MKKSARIGVDIGGTFTDFALLDEQNRTYFAKVSSTPAEPESAVLTGVAELLRVSGCKVDDIVEIVHGTTVGSNTLLQKKGAKCGLITTKGFRDVLEIGRLRTPTMFDLTWDKPEPLVARRYRMEIDERTAADGEILKQVDEKEIVRIGEFFASEGVESVAICLINSYRNSANEERAHKAFAANFPKIWVTASISVLPEIREYERTSTTAVNAYVLPVLRSYLTRLEQKLRAAGIKAPLLVANSNGGLSSARLAQEKPVFFISSGRAAGVVGAQHLGHSIGVEDVIVFDMGGTTASASLIEKGQLTRASEYEFRAGISTPSRFIKAGGYLMRVPTIDVAEVGSGAGSVAWLDEGRMLHVGPVSAGALPGPACYDLGGARPTVTDSNVVLGYLPEQLAGGSMKLNLTIAREVIARDLANPLGLTVENAACGVREIVNTNMARAIRAVTVERGVDHRDFILLAFGGSGPVHACALAKTLGIRRVMFPRAPGVFTAMGMLAGQIERYYLKSSPVSLDGIDPDRIEAQVNDLRSIATKEMAAEGYTAPNVEFGVELDMRFKGQDSEIAIPIGDVQTGEGRAALRNRFLNAYRAIYGYVSRDTVDIVNIRLIARGISGRKIDFAALDTASAKSGGSSATTRRIYFDRDTGWVQTPIVERDDFLKPLLGPVVIQSSDSTVVIPPGFSATLDAAGNIVADLLPE
jgi:N-methylhydantoinase A